MPAPGAPAEALPDDVKRALAALPEELRRVCVGALTGEGAFDGAEGKARLLAGERPTLGGVPDELAVLLQEALAGDPTARPAARMPAGHRAERAPAGPSVCTHRRTAV